MELVEGYKVAISDVLAATADGRELCLGWLDHRVTIVEINPQSLAHQF